MLKKEFHDYLASESNEDFRFPLVGRQQPSQKEVEKNKKVMSSRPHVSTKMLHLGGNSVGSKYSTPKVPSARPCGSTQVTSSRSLSFCKTDTLGPYESMLPPYLRGCRVKRKSDCPAQLREPKKKPNNNSSSAYARAPRSCEENDKVGSSNSLKRKLFSILKHVDNPSLVDEILNGVRQEDIDAMAKDPIRASDGLVKSLAEMFDSAAELLKINDQLHALLQERDDLINKTTSSHAALQKEKDELVAQTNRLKRELAETKSQLKEAEKKKCAAVGDFLLEQCKEISSDLIGESHVLTEKFYLEMQSRYMRHCSLPITTRLKRNLARVDAKLNEEKQKALATEEEEEEEEDNGSWSRCDGGRSDKEVEDEEAENEEDAFVDVEDEDEDEDEEEEEVLVEEEDEDLEDEDFGGEEGKDEQITD